MRPALARLLLALAPVLVAATLFGGAAGCGSSDAGLEVAQGVDLSKMQGKWYEIARLPRTTQTDCHGTTAFYSRNADGSLNLVNQCNVGGSDGPLDTVSMSATVPDSKVQSKLALNVGGYTGDYWILEVGANYEYVVVGHPSRLYLWVLSRTSSLDSGTMQGILDRAKSAQFDTSQLLYTPQPPAGERATSEQPVGPIPQPVKTGCSASGTPAGTGVPWAAGLVALGLAAALRRRAR
jgi:apolipoprotein D and lipocalin family protein